MVEAGHTRCEAQKFEAGTRPNMQVVTTVMRNNRLDVTEERQENERRGLDVDLTMKNYKTEVIKDGMGTLQLGCAHLGQKNWHQHDVLWPITALE
jgi:hypothetical protein